jgi:uncharacterized Fe-S cluster-containing MiaB family protein
MVDTRCLGFRNLLAGDLEIALGLETVCPAALTAINKQMTLEDFDRATDFANEHDILTRTFILIGAPYIAEAKALYWLEKSIQFAVDCGVDQIALIPVRPGNGALEELAADGSFRVPNLADVETALRIGLMIKTDTSSVCLDLWDLESLDPPICCFEPRLQRLRSMNASGQPLPVIECRECGGGK